jgi:hypothetical protein
MRKSSETCEEACHSEHCRGAACVDPKGARNKGDTPTSTPNDKMTPEAPQIILSRIRFISSNENARRVSDLTLPREPTLKASADPDLSFGLLVVFTAAQEWSQKNTNVASVTAVWGGNAGFREDQQSAHLPS